MNAATLPARPALPEHSTDATGVITGNADIGDSCRWDPPQGEPERPVLPGHEHQLDPDAKAFPWLTEVRMFRFVWMTPGIAAGLLALGRWLA